MSLSQIFMILSQIIMNIDEFHKIFKSLVTFNFTISRLNFDFTLTYLFRPNLTNSAVAITYCPMLCQEVIFFCSPKNCNLT